MKVPVLNIETPIILWPAQTLSLTLPLWIMAMGLCPPGRMSKAHFLGNPGIPGQYGLTKNFPRKHTVKSLYSEAHGSHTLHMHTTSKQDCVCVCLLKYEWPLRTFEVSPQETNSDKHPEKQHEGKQDYTRRRKVNYKNSTNILREKKILHQSSNPKWHVN